MSIEVSEEAVEEFTDGVVRNFDAFPSQAWVTTASAVVKSHGNQAAAQLVPGEQVEWITPGIVHRYGKVWPNAILIVTPHRLILSASRGALRAKHDINSLYRGPESLLSVTRRLLPGSNKELWMVELASELGPFVFAFPDFNRAGDLAELTAAFVSGRATYADELRQILLDGVPLSPTQDVIANRPDPFTAAQEDFAAADSQVTVAMPAISPNPTGTTETQTTPFTIPAQYAPTDSYDEPEAEPEPVELPPADWYEDPLHQAHLRYWDGTAWTRSTVA